MSLNLITPPAVEPVTTSEMKLQLGFGPMEDTDQLREQIVAEQIRPAIVAARGLCEDICARAFITQQWQLTLQEFPWWHMEYEMGHRLDIEIPLPTFQSLTSFTYIDATGTQQNMMGTGGWGYQLVSGSDRRPARLRPPIGQAWPVTLLQQVDAVTIAFECGFGPTAGSVPYAVRSAVKLCAKWIYEGGTGTVPQSVLSLLSPYVVNIV